MRRESRHRPWIIFLVFCCSSNICLLADFIFMALQWVWDPFSELTQNGCLNFWMSLYHHGWCSTVIFTLLHLVSNSPNGFSIWVSYSQSELVTNLLLIHFYFQFWYLLLWWPGFQEPLSLPYLFLPFHRTPLSWIVFSYMFLSFPPSYGWLLKQSTGVPNYIKFSVMDWVMLSWETPGPIIHIQGKYFVTWHSPQHQWRPGTHLHGNNLLWC